MNLRRQSKLALAALALLTGMTLAQAKTIRIGNQGDALSMDPHSLNESLQLSVTGNVYEGLLARGKNLELQAGLATSLSLIHI